MLSGTQHRPFRLKTFQILALQQFRGSCVFHIFSFPGVFSRSNGVKIGVKPIALSFYTKNLETVGAVQYSYEILNALLGALTATTFLSRNAFA